MVLPVKTACPSNKPAVVFFFVYRQLISNPLPPNSLDSFAVCMLNLSASSSRSDYYFLCIALWPFYTAAHLL